MSATDPGPRCPRCRRPLAAWRLDHCVYCGEKFPAELKEGFAAPEALKWVERPPLPTDLAKKMEMMRIVEAKAPKKTRTLTAIVGGLAVPVFVALFYLLYSMMKKLFPGGGLLVIVIGVGVIGYLVAMLPPSRRGAAPRRAAPGAREPVPVMRSLSSPAPAL